MLRFQHIQKVNQTMRSLSRSLHMSQRYHFCQDPNKNKPKDEKEPEQENLFQHFKNLYQTKLEKLKKQKNDPKNKILDNEEEKENALDKGFNKIAKTLTYENLQETLNHSTYRPIYFALLVAMGLFIAKDQYDRNSGYISYQEFFYSYLNHNLVNDIVLYNHESTLKSTIAQIDIQGEGIKKLVLRNSDQFLQQLEENQSMLGKSKDNFIPVKYEYALDKTQLFEYGIKSKILIKFSQSQQLLEFNLLSISKLNLPCQSVVVEAKISCLWENQKCKFLIKTTSKSLSKMLQVWMKLNKKFQNLSIF